MANSEIRLSRIDGGVMVAVWREGEDGPYFFHFARNETDAWKLAEKMAEDENLPIRNLLCEQLPGV